MSVFGFESRSGNGTGNRWNYSDRDKEGFMVQISGTVVEIKEVAATKFNSNEIDRWPDGNPKLNICIVIQGQSGRELDWVFAPGGLQKPSAAMAACRAALTAAGMPAKTVEELGGLHITVSTAEPPQGFTYGQGNPRPWSVQINGPGTVPFRGVKEYTEQAQQAPQPQPVMQQPMQQAPAPVTQIPQAPMQPVAPAPVAQAPVVQAPAPEPAGGPYYEEDIPF